MGEDVEAVVHKFKVKTTIRKMMEKGFSVGHDEKGPGIEDNILNIDETFCRIMVVQGRKI